MSDAVSTEKRSAMMSGIRAKDTKPELIVRKALFASGFRFRLHNRKLPGSPDIVLAKRHVAIFVHGCFWHLHRNCKLSKIPATRTDFWTQKLTANATRDIKATDQLLALGWRVLVVWECHIKAHRGTSELQQQLTKWIHGIESFGQLPDQTKSIAMQNIQTGSSTG
jgi:DNA mismatch endonuclease, patch repair protein